MGFQQNKRTCSGEVGLTADPHVLLEARFTNYTTLNGCQESMMFVGITGDGNCTDAQRCTEIDFNCCFA